MGAVHKLGERGRRLCDSAIFQHGGKMRYERRGEKSPKIALRNLLRRRKGFNFAWILNNGTKKNKKSHIYHNRKSLGF